MLRFQSHPLCILISLLLNIEYSYLFSTMKILFEISFNFAFKERFQYQWYSTYRGPLKLSARILVDNNNQNKEHVFVFSTSIFFDGLHEPLYHHRSQIQAFQRNKMLYLYYILVFASIHRSRYLLIYIYIVKYHYTSIT